MQKSSNYEPAFDGLRAIAMAAVMGFHYAPRVVTGGSLGVDVFFPLSGWLVTAILFREIEKTGRVDYPVFLTRRVGRLFPPLAVLLLAYAVAAPFLIPRAAPGRWVDIAFTATFLGNIRETFWPRGNPLAHTWFLGLQVQFYLVWPFVLLALRRRGREQAALILIGLWVVLTAGRVIWNQTLAGPAPYYLTPWHATGLVLGSALALRPVQTPAWAGWPALALLVVLLVWGHTRAHPLITFLVSQPVVEIATAILITSPPAILRLPPLPFLGRISYGVYLWHVPFMWMLPPRGPVNLAILIGGSILAGWLSYRFIDQPLARVRKPAPAKATA